MQQTVLGIFQDRDGAEDAIDELEGLDYDPKDISIIMKDSGEAREFAHDTGANVAGGAVSGAVTGGVLGGIAGLLVGIGAITLPGLGALLIGGPIAAALGLTGAAAATTTGAVTGALAGGLVGALVSLGVPEEEAHEYEDRIRAGAILIAVPASLRTADEVKQILSDNGAEQIRTIDAGERERERLSRIHRSERPSAFAGAKGGRTRKRRLSNDIDPRSERRRDDMDYYDREESDD